MPEVFKTFKITVSEVSSNNSKLCLVSRVLSKNGPIQWRQPFSLRATPSNGCERMRFHSHFVHVVAF